MLRSVDHDGAGVYIQHLCDALFQLDQVNQYVLFYIREDQLGRYARVPNVEERVVPAAGKLLWDQVYLPMAARRENLDVLFHHKFSIPIVAPCPAAMTRILQEPGLADCELEGSRGRSTFPGARALDDCWASWSGPAAGDSVRAEGYSWP